MTELRLPSRYTLIDRIGSGLFASVYRGRDTELERDIALKISDMSGRSAEEQTRIRRELRISCKLRHPNIGSGFDGFEVDHHAILCLPLISGGTLDAPKIEFPPDQKRKARLMRDLCGAVAYVHQVGLAHGDIKPQNVLLGRNHYPYLVDFGSCESAKNQAAKPDAAIGTPAYLAPEIARGESGPTIATDIYALGATLFELLCGRPPFEGEPQAIIHKIATQPLPRLRHLNANIDAALEAIILKACNEEASQRYKTATELRDDLDRYARDQPVSAQPTTTVRTARLWSRRNPLAAGLVAALLLVGTLGTTVSLIGRQAANANRRDLEASQVALINRGQEARQAESKLQALLEEIKLEEYAAQKAAVQASEHRIDVENVNEKIKAIAEGVAKRRSEFKRLTDKLQKVETDQASTTASLGEMQLQLDRKKALQDREKALQKERSRRTELLAHLRKQRAKLNAREWSNPRKVLPENDADLKGLFARTLEWQFANKRTELTPHGRQITTPVTRIIFDRSGKHAMLLNGSNDSLLLTVRPRVGLLQIRWRDKDQRQQVKGIAELAAFHPGGSRIAVYFRGPNDQHAIAVQNIGTTSPGHRVPIEASRVVPIELSGRILAIRFMADDRILYLCKNLATRDVELRQLGAAQPLWSCRQARTEVIESAAAQKDDVQLWPFFLDVGTDPWSHLCFVSTPLIADQDAATRTVVHSVDLTSGQVASFDCGRHPVLKWPHQWQLGEFYSLGAGSGSLWTSDPPTTKNRRFSPVRDVGTRAAYRKLQVCREEWTLIAKTSSDSSRLVYPDGGRIGKKYKDNVICLDRVAGQVIIFGSDTVIYDLLARQSLVLSSNRAYRNSKLFVSPSRDLTITLAGDRIYVTHYADWEEGLYQDHEVFEARLKKVADRLAGSALVAIANRVVERQTPTAFAEVPVDQTQVIDVSKIHTEKPSEQQATILLDKAIARLDDDTNPTAVVDADVRGIGAFGFPQQQATVLCDNNRLRVSMWNNAEYLYVQAVLWSDDDHSTGDAQIGDYSHILLDLDDDKSISRGDRNYSLYVRPKSPGLMYQTQFEPKSSSWAQRDSPGRGAIRYVRTAKDEIVRVDSFLVPLNEITKNPGDTLRLAYWGLSPQPKLVIDSVGYIKNNAGYPAYNLPRDRFHEITLSTDNVPFDIKNVPRGRDDK